MSTADDIAAKVRVWYEANRESWLDRIGTDTTSVDAFMLALVAEVSRVIEEVTPAPEPVPPPVAHKSGHRKSK